jgi:shikimate dehydrogenase
MTAFPRRGAAVLGSPIAHSLSPVLHRAAYDALGLTDWTYRAVECTEASLPEVLRRLDDEQLAGVSLTMPLKRAVLPLLARVEGLARDVGAANTVVFGGVAGEWWGGNTDVPGFVAALRRAGVDVAQARVLVLGGGATAASALAALADLGVHAATVAVRRAAAADDLRVVASRFGVEVVPLDWADAADAVERADVVVATVPAGATDGMARTLPSRVDGVLFDVVYAPWPTALAAAWSARGGRTVGGLELLVEQAALQVTLMTGLEAPVDAMRTAGLAALHPPR